MEPWQPFEKFWFGLGRRLAKIGLKPLAFLKISPNQVTLFNFLIFIPLASFCFSRDTYKCNLMALAFCLFHSYFDFVDGLLAQETRQLTRLGAWLDPKLDILAANIIFMGICYGVVKAHPVNFWLIVAFSALFGQIGLLSLVFQYHDAIYTSKDFLNKFHASLKVGFLDKVIKNIITLEASPFLFLGTFRYLLFFGAILNQLRIVLLIVAIFGNIRWIVMFWVYAKCLSERGSRLEVINLLKQFIKQ